MRTEAKAPCANTRGGDPTTAQELQPLAFIYDRKSTPTLGVLLMRIQACQQYAEDQGWQLAGDWVDEGDVALTDHRPQFNRLMAKMLGAHRDGDREVVCLVNDFDRLSHKAEVRARFIKRVHLAGGRVETIVGERSDDKTGRLTGAPLS